MIAEVLMDWVLPFSLVFALVLLVQFKRQVMKVDEHAYHFVTSGLGFVALAVVLRLYHQGGMLDQMPMVSDPIFYRLIFWSAVTAGVALVISGSATFLPLLIASRKNNHTRMSGLELIRTIERLMAVEPRTDTLFATTLDHIVATFTVSRATIYRREFGSSTMRVVATKGSSEYCDMPVTIDTSSVESNLNDLFAGSTSVSFAIRPENRTEALLVVQSSELLSQEDKLNISVVCEILGRRLSLDLFAQRESRLHSHVKMREDILARSLEISSLGRTMGMLLSRLRDQYFLDQASICLVRTDSGKMVRYSIGATGSVLTEKGMPLPTGIAEIITNGQIAQNSVILMEQATSFGLPAEMRSTVAVWHQHSRKTVALLLLATTRPGCFPSSEIQEFDYLPSLVQHLLTSLVRRTEEMRSSRQAGEIQAVLNGFIRRPDLSMAANRLAAMLKRALAVSIVRITAADQSPAFVRTIGLATDDRALMAKSGDAILRSLLGAHEKVLRSGRSLWLDDTRSDMTLSIAESQAVLTSPLGAVAIAPIPSTDGSCGAISIASGESDRRSGFSPVERRLIHLVAQVVGMMLAYDGKVQTNGAWSITRNSDRQLRSRMKSSLSGILGSLELIRMGEHNGQPIDHYLRIIDSSARRINDYLTTGATTPPKQEREEVHVQQP